MYRIALWAGAAALLAGCKLPGIFPEQETLRTFDNTREEQRSAYHLHHRSKRCGYDLNNGQFPVLAPDDTVTGTGLGKGG